jgi:hypothetical protein
MTESAAAEPGRHALARASSGSRRRRAAYIREKETEAIGDAIGSSKPGANATLAFAAGTSPGLRRDRGNPRAYLYGERSWHRRATPLA